MAPSENSTLDIAKESEKADSVVQCVTESLTDILAGNIKLSALSKCSNIKLTYVLYGRLLDYIKIQPMKTTETLIVILKFLFPDLVPFLPNRIAAFSASIRLYIERARKLGNLESIYQPISSLYAAKLEAEWEDFTKWGVTKSMLITGPLVPRSGSKTTLANKHIVILCRLRNSYHLCWFKVVPKWLHFFGILNSKVLLKPMDIKRQWTQILEQAEQLEGEELNIFLETPYQLPLPSKSQRSFKLEQTNDSIPADISVTCNNVGKDTPSLADLPQSRCSSYCKESTWAQNLRQKVDELQLLLENKNKEMTSFLNKLTEKEKTIDYLTLRLSKMKIVKNHWLMKYRRLAGVNLFAEDSEFDVNLQHTEKVKENAKCIRRTVNLGCSNESSKFVDKFLDDGFVEQLLECVIAHGLNIDLSSNVVLMFLQELVIHSERKLLNNLEFLQNGYLNAEPNVMLNYNSLSSSTSNDDTLITNQVGSSTTCNSPVVNNTNCLHTPSFSSHDALYPDVDASLLNDKWSDLYEKTCEISQIDPKILSEATSGKNCQDGDWPPKVSETSPIEILDNSSILLNAELFSKMALTKSDSVTGEILPDTSYTAWDTEKSIAELSKNLVESDYPVSGFSSTPNDVTTASDAKSLFEMNSSKNLQKTFGHKTPIFKAKDYNEVDDISTVGDIWSYNKFYKHNNNYLEEKNYFQSSEFNNNYIDITADSDGTSDIEPKPNSNREQDIDRKESNRLHTERGQLAEKINVTTDEVSGVCTDGFLSETSINTIKSKPYPLKDPTNLKKRPRGRPKSLKRMKIQKTS
ncbi:Hypothetical predicted protein [Octopus vulgaris]|uniref:Uncharacterized protein n=1 Tax=Octopus vulgaris TaxID=6645 RepID=A0AA36AQN1_OCTVU|nr:Hypothetical predicted protein [Octopus vulgaris]